jgi:tetratricopeptide (TPR) repeat protein
MRQYAILLFLCACTTLSKEDAESLEICQRNAPIYFEGGRLEQALTQAERGLSIAPDDYKLNVIKGAVLLRASENNPKLLDQATQQLERIFEWRSPLRHEPAELLYYALAQQKQGLRSLGEAIRVEERAQRTPEAIQHEALLKDAAQERNRATEKLQQADRLLGYLVELGDLLRVVYNHRLQIARQLGDDVAFEKATKSYFLEAAKEQAFVDEELKRTVTPDYEAEQYTLRKQLKVEEVNVRALYADWCFQRERYEDAREQLDLALKIDPTRSDNYYNRGCALLKMEEISLAKDDFRRFLAMAQLPASSPRMTYATKALQQ